MNENRREIRDPNISETLKLKTIRSIFAHKDRYIGKLLIKKTGDNLADQDFELLDIYISNQDTIHFECRHKTFHIPASEIISCVEDRGFSIDVRALGNLSLEEV